MKILSIGSQFFSKSFRASGIELCSVVPSKMVRYKSDIPFDFYGRARECSDFIESVITSFEPDLIFQGDHSGPLIHCGLEKYRIPKLWYAVDVHLHHVWYKHYAVLFDKVFCAQKNFIETMSMYSSDVEWMPLFYNGSFTDFIPWNERAHFISFVGTMNAKKNPQRIALFEGLKKRGVNVTIVSGDYEPVYRQSKIVINQSVANDLNLRFFEAAGCGALLITDQLTHSMNDILIQGEDYLVYKHGNLDDLEEKINWVKNNDALAEEMARKAHAKILNNHTEHHRADQILKWYRDDRCNGKKKDDCNVLSHLSWTFDCCSKLNLPELVTDFFKENTQQIAKQTLKCTNNKDARALLLFAENAFQNGEFSIASEKLSLINNTLEDKEFSKRYLTLKTMIDYIDGKKEQALSILSNLLKEYPDDNDLKLIQQTLNK